MKIERYERDGIAGLLEKKKSLLEGIRLLQVRIPDVSAYFYVERPCWENAYTQNEILLGLRKDCQSCRVFKLYQESDFLK